MTDQDFQTIATLCLLAAFADGHLSPGERTRIQDIMQELGQGRVGSPAPSDSETDLRVLAGRLSGPEASRLAFEMAVAVCHADAVVTTGEEDFIRRLWPALGLDQTSAERIEREVGALALVRVGSGTVGDDARVAADLDGTILRHAMLAGAAELLPQTVATIAVLPIQMWLVNTLARAHGHKALDAEHFTELLATLGIGATSQVFDGIARKLLGGFLGGVLGGVAAAATGTTLAFGTTYAVGHVAKTYYAQGRKLDTAELRALYPRLLEDGKTLYPRMEEEIKSLAGRLSFSDLVSSIKNGLGTVGIAT